VFPNPAYSEANIVLNEPVTGRLEILDVIGNLVKQVPLKNSRSLLIKLDDLNAGMYFIIVTDTTKKQKLQSKIIKAGNRQRK
jgi:hypothetical protein